MPLYEYQCDVCDHRFEVIQKFSDSSLQTCVKCGGGVRKLPSSPAIQFKGSGWYITDYARAGKSEGKPESKSESDSSSAKSDSNSSASESKSESASESKSESKGESKADTKTESKTNTESKSSPTTPSTS